MLNSNLLRKLDMQDLMVFIAVYDQSSVTEVSETLFVSQSTVSYSLKKLRTDYVDLRGEPGWKAQMIPRLQGPAAVSGARIVFSCGFDSIPFDLGVVYLQHEAMQRDMGFSPDQLNQYLRAERFAIQQERAMAKAQGDRFAGAWLEQKPNGEFRYVVATTSVQPQRLPAGVVLLDTGEPVARQLERLLAAGGLLGGGHGRLTVATSGAPLAVTATVDRLFGAKMHVEHWEP